MHLMLELSPGPGIPPYLGKWTGFPIVLPVLSIGVMLVCCACSYALPPPPRSKLTQEMGKEWAGVQHIMTQSLDHRKKKKKKKKKKNTYHKLWVAGVEAESHIYFHGRVRICLQAATALCCLEGTSQRTQDVLAEKLLVELTHLER